MKKILNLSICVASLAFCTSSLQASSKYDSIKFGDFSIGGAVRVNFIHDSSDTDTKNGSKDDEGVFDLDMVRLDVDYKNGSYLGQFQYRWYPGYGVSENGTNYSFIHTAWLGYAFDDKSQVQVGINRVPFGPWAWGISQSWYFDQHYYVGLTDDMDLGVKFNSSFGDIKYDLAYYPQSEPNGIGKGEVYTNDGTQELSGDSARYAYDVVGDFEEKNQINARMIYTKMMNGKAQEFGVSLLYSQLEAQKSGVDDGSRYAISAHMKNRFGNFTLATQLTRYEMLVDADNDGKDDTLTVMGGFNYGEGVASKAWLPGFSLSYILDTPNIDWLDYALPYIEYSNIVKDEDSFNDSYMLMIGSALACGNWYTYVDMAFANGNYFVGPYKSKDGGTNNFGANTGNEMEHRLNINFGYYF